MVINPSEDGSDAKEMHYVSTKMIVGIAEHISGRAIPEV